MKSLYIHIPFCAQKCLYCDFNSFSKKDELINDYIESLKKEIQKYNLESLKTVYFGGGTPSYINEKYIKEILQMLKIEKSAEVTLELNPGTVDENKLKNYYEMGINRLSIGLQETDNDILKEIGRIHTLKDFENTYNLARKIGFKNISVDLMFGLPNQTFEKLKKSVDYLIKIKPEHISCYSLILHNDIFKNLPPEDEERKMYHYIVDQLKKNGYTHYEISNFSKIGYESKHNMVYWNQEEYIGVGAGASSYANNVRYTNEKNLEKYIEKVNNNEKLFEVEETQNIETKINEYMILKLRLIDGININAVNEKFNIDVISKYKLSIEKMKKYNLLEIEDGNIKLTAKGLDLANIVWEEFV